MHIIVAVNHLAYRHVIFQILIFCFIQANYKAQIGLLRIKQQGLFILKNPMLKGQRMSLYALSPSAEISTACKHCNKTKPRSHRQNGKKVVSTGVN